MNHEMRIELANTGLDILKKSVLLVLYELTDPIGRTLKLTDPIGRTLKQGKIREWLGIRRPEIINENVNSLILGVLLDLRTDGYARDTYGSGWAITEEGVSYIEK